MGQLFHELLYRPFFNILVWLYQTVAFRDLGVAIILLTIFVRFLLIPLYQKSIKSQREIAMIQPEMKKIQEVYKDDKEKQSLALMELYKTHKVNPFSGIVVLFLQIPILIALYQVILNIFKSADSFPQLYRFVTLPETINPISFGFLHIGVSGNLILAIIVGVSQFFQTKLIMSRAKQHRGESGGTDQKKSDQEEIAEMVNKQMMIAMPILVGFMAYRFASGLAIYWITSTVFTIIQEYIVIKKSSQEKSEIGKVVKIREIPSVSSGENSLKKSRKKKRKHKKK